MCIMTKGSGAPVVHNNGLTGRYVGLWAENTSPLVHNNRIADFEHGIYTIGSNAYLLNNKVINSLYDGIVMTRGSSCLVSNNTLAGHFCRGVSVFDSSPLLSNNILTQNGTGLFCQDASPVTSYNCVAGNRESDYDGVAASPTDVLSDPLLAGVGVVSSITGVDDDTLVCTDGHWEAGKTGIRSRKGVVLLECRLLAGGAKNPGPHQPGPGTSESLCRGTRHSRQHGSSHLRSPHFRG